jgi:hypothetical protein
MSKDLISPDPICRKFGCITTAFYYEGLPQASCRRCGMKTHYAASFVPNFEKAWEPTPKCIIWICEKIFKW